MLAIFQGCRPFLDCHSLFSTFYFLHAFVLFYCIILSPTKSSLICQGKHGKSEREEFSLYCVCVCVGSRVALSVWAHHLLGKGCMKCVLCYLMNSSCLCYKVSARKGLAALLMCGRSKGREKGRVVKRGKGGL